MLQYFDVFGLSINSYKFFFCLGLISVPIILFTLRRSFRFGKGQTFFYSVFVILLGLASARLTATLKQVMLGFASGGTYHDDELLRNYGIPIFLPAFLLLYCLLCKDNFRKLSDAVAPCVYSVMTFVKIGCTFWGCCNGEASEHGIWNERLQMKTFPVQLYDAITSAVIVIVCLWLIVKSKRKGTGYVYPIGGILFSITKGFWEFFRVHESEYERSFLGTGFTLWQYWLLILLIGCIVWLLVLKRKGSGKTPKRS